MVLSFKHWFGAGEEIPDKFRPIFKHLYWDIAWYGLLAGSSLAFNAVYAARLDASAFAIGLMNAGPALLGLFVALPMGRWLQHRPVGRAVFWAALLSRLGFLLWLLLPGLLPNDVQVWIIVISVLVMALPGNALAIGFNAMYASAVPPEHRGHMAGTRNALLSVVLVATSLICGYLLNNLPFVWGYRLLFGLGCLGAFMSTVHLWFLRHITEEVGAGPAEIRGTIRDFARPGQNRTLGITMRATVAPRVFARGVNLFDFSVLQRGYGKTLGGLFLFHFGQFLPVALFPIYWVERLHFNDGEISAGTAVFHLTVLLGSLQLRRLVKRWGNHKITTWGVLFLSTYPLLTALMTGFGLYIVASIIGGLAWALVGGTVGNYLLDKVPTSGRSAYLSWYNLSLNAAVLLGSLGGPILAGYVGLEMALLASFAMRALAALAIWRAG